MSTILLIITVLFVVGAFPANTDLAGGDAPLRGGTANTDCG